jgi:hypothetical protein
MLPFARCTETSSKEIKGLKGINKLNEFQTALDFCGLAANTHEFGFRF